MDYMNPLGKLDSCRTWWLHGVYAEALADQAEVGLCFVAWAEVGLGQIPAASLANTEL